MNELLAIGERHGIPVIEDSAEAIGSVYYGKRAGSVGRFGAFSFHGTKTITTGEGGMFVTNDDQLFEKVLTLSNHGRARGQTKQFWPDVIGFKYKISNIQSAIGCAQVERIKELTQRKREIFKHYRESLATLPGLSMNPEPENTVNGAWMPTVVFEKETGVTREKLQKAFAAENIDARVFFCPLSSLPMFEPVKSNVSAWSIPSRAINLPSYHDMRLDEQEKIEKIIRMMVK
jgi:perosamine synthetase